jgi:L-2-hydroxyglutarate oxidase LhgO
MLEIETVVIGAGVVGLAVARALALAGRDVLVVEAAGHVGTETSSRNSEVIHSGIYYPTGSLKARLCVAGRDRLYAYCAARGIPHRRTGKFIVAVSQADLPVLERYRALARANGVGDLPWVTPAQIRAAEPALEVVGAIQSPLTGIVDSHALMMSLWADLESAGGTVAFRSRVHAGRRVGAAFALDVAGFGEPLQCRELVNAAGLSAPALARALAGCADTGAPPAFYARGHYFALSGPAPFRRLIYPVAEPGGLGIHVTLDLAGQVRFGPDVEWVDAVDYGFDASRRNRFAAAIRRYYPGLDEDRLQPAYVGVRPKISGPADQAADFRIDGPGTHGVPGLVHLFGIESPGLTACLAIADQVREALR